MNREEMDFQRRAIIRLIRLRQDEGAPAAELQALYDEAITLARRLAGLLPAENGGTR